MSDLVSLEVTDVDSVETLLSLLVVPVTPPEAEVFHFVERLLALSLLP